MSKDINIVLLGAGAIGVLPGAKLLVTPGVNLSVAASGERLERYRKDGIYLNDKKLPFSYLAPDELPAADIIIVATKMPSLETALETVAPAVNDNTVFLPFLNGISASDIISSRFPQATVLKGFFLGHASVRDGNLITHDGVGTFYCGGEKNALERIAGVLRMSGIDVDTPENFEIALWQKFTLNVGINQTQGYFRANYGEVQKSPEMLRFAWDLMEEAVSVGRAAGVALGDEVVESAMMVICQMPEEVKTSMLQDLEAGRETEIAAFAGTLCRLAEKYGIDVPGNRMVLEKLSR